MATPNLSRRRLLALSAACAGFGLGSAVPASAFAQTKSEPVAIVDWALLETALALGIVPRAAVELVLYREIVVEPPVPEEVVDLGLRGSINFELLATLAPERIYGSNYTAWAHDLMGAIAPVTSLPIYLDGTPPYERAEAAMRAMAADFGMEAEAERYIAETAETLDARGRRLEAHHDRPLLIINIGDAAHFRVFGEDSMYGATARRMGFDNAWGAKTSYSASAPVSIGTLADYPEAAIVIVSPIPPDAKRALPESVLWNAMPAVRAGRVATLDTINPFGALPAARRFARLLEGAMTDSA